jgi:general secretion pathway protein F
MSTFRYEALSRDGQTIKGTIDADSLRAALTLLNQRGVKPYLAEPASAGTQSNKSSFSLGQPGLEWRMRLIRQLATLLAAGVTLDRALRLLTDQTTNKRERAIVEAMALAVTAGKPLSAAMATSAGQFKADEIGLIKASEQTGSLVPMLEELSTLLERRMQLRSKLASALVYPAFLLTLAPVSLIIIATVLVPNLAPLFENSGATMPFSLQAMIWASTEFRDRGALWFGGFILILALLFWFWRLEAISEFWDRLSVKLPFIGIIKRRAESARICRTLGSLIRSGAPLQAALQAVVEVTTSKPTQDNLRKVRETVIAGSKLGDALKIIPSIDSSSLQMIAIGEETNKLETMLHHVAEGEEKALATYIDRLMTLLTPLLTIALGLFVGGIVMSIMRAILSVNELVAK